MDECPDGYQVDENQTCYRAAENIFPFITMVGPIIFLLVVLISVMVNHRATKPITAFIALQSAWMTGFWVYQVIFLIRDNHNSSPIIVVMAIFFNYCINCFFYEYMRNKMLKGKD